MSAETFLNGRVVLHCGDSRDVAPLLEDNSADSLVGDPPYALTSIVKRFGSDSAAACIVPDGGTGAYARASAGFMGKKWDTGEAAFDPAFWKEWMRVLKPGGFIAMSSGTRTYHRLTTAIELAGFEVRDSVLEMLASQNAGLAFLDSLNDEQRSAFIQLLDEQSPTGLLGWCYGSGFPKSHDSANALDNLIAGPWCDDDEMERGFVSHFAAWFEGFGTALKPAWEPIVLARKPLSEKTVAANIRRWGTGAINIDGCRVGTDEKLSGGGSPILRFGGQNDRDCWGEGYERKPTQGNAQGRWPANIIHDGSEEVLAAFPDSETTRIERPSVATGSDGWGSVQTNRGARGYDGEGSAARFFYAAKADSDDRLGSKHPTVKPVDLMQWLCRLVTPKGGTVIDMFAGTGTTGEAAWREGLNAILIEKIPDYQADIRRRMALCLAGPEERKRESAKAKHGDKPFEAGSLFASIESAEAAE